ncbi:MAG: hypothetical protein ABIJ09_12065 [Pseudomonadota bacterium]
MTRRKNGWPGLLVTLLLCLPLLAANCPTTDDDDDDGKDQAVRKLWDAYCDLLTRCDSQWGKLFENKAVCVDAWNKMTSCELEGVDFVAVDSYVAAEGDRCIAWLNAANCDTFVFTEEQPAECALVFGDDGAGANQSCENTGCKDDLFCEYSSTDGVCAVCQNRASVDQACNEGWPYMPCLDGLYCDETSNTCKALKADLQTCQSGEECSSGSCPAGTCAARLARDAACTDNDVCEAALVCRSGTCQDRGGTNEACTSTEDCFMWSHVCYQNVCTPIGVCQLAGIGEPCAWGCVNGAYCDSSMGQCKAYVAIEQPCQGWSECGPDAYCDYTRSVCLTYVGLNQPCSSGYCIEGTFCDYDATTPVCAAPRANGQTCAYDMECQSDYCDPTGQQCAAEPACTMP